MPVRAEGLGEPCEVGGEGLWRAEVPVQEGNGHFETFRRTEAPTNDAIFEFGLGPSKVDKCRRGMTPNSFVFTKKVPGVTNCQFHATALACNVLKPSY